MTLRGEFTEVVPHERIVHTETMALGSGQTIGSLVETHRRWDDVPPWPKRADRMRRRATVDGEMRKSESRGLRLHVVEERGAEPRQGIGEQTRVVARALGHAHALAGERLGRRPVAAAGVRL